MTCPDDGLIVLSLLNSQSLFFTLPEPSSCMNYKKHLREYEHKSYKKAGVQFLNSLIPSILLWISNFYIYHHLSLWYWLLTIPLTVGFMTRLFIIFHDCGHQNWTDNKGLNSVVGHILGFIFFVPFPVWSYFHNLHHLTAGDLDRRSVLDIQTLTVNEYEALSPAKRFSYRIYRSVFGRFFFFTQLVFLVGFRIPAPLFSKKGAISILISNVLYLALFFGISQFYSLKDLFFVLFPVYYLTLGFGGFLFFIQHQFEETYWERSKDWNFDEVALLGSSFWDIPRIFHWFSGNIGYHHVHHLSMSVPNYNLPLAHKKLVEIGAEIRPVSLSESLFCIQYKLWDEDRKKMIKF